MENKSIYFANGYEEVAKHFWQVEFNSYLECPFWVHRGVVLLNEEDPLMNELKDQLSGKHEVITKVTLTGITFDAFELVDNCGLNTILIPENVAKQLGLLPESAVKTNEEFVLELMNYSPFGTLSQVFIIEAIRFYSEAVEREGTEASDEDSTKVIFPAAWHGIAVDISRRLKANYEEKQ
jgi:hypothetical protein